MAQDAFHQHAIPREFGLRELPGPDLSSWGAWDLIGQFWGEPTGASVSHKHRPHSQTEILVDYDVLKMSSRMQMGI